MAVDYKSFDFQIYEYLIRLDQLLAQAKGLPEAEGWRKRIEEERERIRTRRFRVAVVGEFRKGKTSFINALLGREILPVDALPTTATINRITFGAVPRASLHYRDGQVQEVDIAELASYVTKLTQESAGYAARIEEAVVEYPSVFCQNYVDLIDTPGMNDEEQMNAVTVAQLEKIDLAIVAVSATTPFSDTESSFVARLVESPEICQIILVITKIDQIREREREKLLDYMTGRVCSKVEEKLRSRHEEDDDIMAKYRRIFGDLQVFGVCALDALEAREYNDEALLARSGFQELNERLPQLILASQNNSAIIKAVGTVRAVSGECLRRLEGAGEALAQKRKTLLARREEFASLAYSLADSCLDEARVQIFERINGLPAKAAEVKRGFIGALTQVRSPDRGLISQALCEQAGAAAGDVNSCIRKELLPALNQLCLDEAAKGLGRLSGQLFSLIKEGEAFAQARELLVSLAGDGTIFLPMEAGKVFAWDENFPVPAADRLLDRNLIEQIDERVKRALEKYTAEKRRAAAGWLDAMTGRIQDRIEEIVVEVFQAAGRQEKEWEQEAAWLDESGIEERLNHLREENDLLEQRFYTQLYGNGKEDK